MFPFRPKAQPKMDAQITYPPTLRPIIYPPKDYGSVVSDDSELPFSPYTGQPYDPAWVTGGSGKTNRATIALMKSIEFRLAQRAKEQSHAE
jgi:hypothetical protein